MADILLESGITALGTSGTVTINFDVDTPDHNKYRDVSSDMTGAITLQLQNAIAGDAFVYTLRNITGSAHDLTLPSGRVMGDLTSLTSSIGDGQYFEVTGKLGPFGLWSFSATEQKVAT